MLDCCHMILYILSRVEPVADYRYLLSTTSHLSIMVNGESEQLNGSRLMNTELTKRNKWSTYCTYRPGAKQLLVKLLVSSSELHELRTRSQRGKLQLTSADK